VQVSDVTLEGVDAGTQDGRRRAAEAAVILLATFSAVAVLWLCRDVFVPLTISIVVAAVLRPVVRRLQRLRVPAPAASAAVVIATLLLVAVVLAALEQPVRALSSEVPKNVEVVRGKLGSLAARVRGAALGRGSETPAGAASQPAPRAGAATQPAADSAPRDGATPQPPAGALGRAFSLTTSLLAEIVEEILLVFFLLAAGDAWLEKMSRIARSRERAERWRTIAGEMHDVVARYLLVTLLINLCQAVIIGLALWALGVPSPFLWGALTFVAEFIPYLGGMAMIGLLLLVGLSGNQGLLHALLPPAIYLVVTTLQNNLVSPVAYGRGLRLNPTMILVGVMFWWLAWGVAGAFLAVPILASLRVIGARRPSLAPMAVLLEE
jgi:predicted PurR-regulated permease PerM